ncbi:MAG: IS6 family transposase [Oceanospirillaceae bacterium]|jgi:IS6 family transposase
MDKHSKTVYFYLSARCRICSAKSFLGKALKGFNEWEVPPTINRVEADHGNLKWLINRVREFQSMKTADAKIKGCEVMYMFKKGQFNFWHNK